MKKILISVGAPLCLLMSVVVVVSTLEQSPVHIALGAVYSIVIVAMLLRILRLEQEKTELKKELDEYKAPYERYIGIR
jgi:cobalamin biosynthesis protein CobD/CbiB